MHKPWKSEPNEKKFEYKGLVCEIIRHQSMGHLCGCVNIPILKQAKGKMAQFQSFFIEYDVIDGSDGSDVYDQFDDIFNIGVHGGITFSRVMEKEQGKVFVIGFDCGHYMDLIPSMYEQFKDMPWRTDNTDIYRTIEYVEAECKSMVDQLLEEEKS